MQLTDKTGYTSYKSALTKVHGLWRSFALTMILVVLSVTGSFESIDGRIYDFLVRSTPALNAGEREVVLIESPATAFPDSSVRWNTLVDELASLGAKQVVFTAMPEGDEAMIDGLKSNPQVILGTTLDGDAAHDKQRGGLGRNALPQAVADTSESLQGVHRYQHYAYEVGGGKVASVEALAARRLGMDVPEDGKYLVNFSGSADSFPRVKLTQALDGGLVEDMVRGRIVLIGVAGDRFQQTVVTPLTDGRSEMTELEYHGYALDSLLQDKAIAALPPFAQAAILVVLWLACLLVLQPMPFRKAMLSATLLTAGLGLLEWLLLGVHFHFPIVGAVLVIGSSLVSIFHSKTEHQNQELARLATETNLAASGRLTGQGDPADASFWSHVLSMVDQILPLTRVVLLERIEGAHRLREVSGLRCSLEMIGERRRDFERMPYSTAIAKEEAIEVRDYLKDAQEGELQFLMPLSWNGKVLGFWAFGIHQSRIENRPTLMAAIDVTGKRLSELMFERHRNAEQRSLAGSWQDHLIDQRDVSIQRLSQHLGLIDRHINVLEDMFNGLAAPTMVYDLFGRPLISNASMKSLLKSAEIQAESQSAADFLEAACKISADEARIALVGVVFEGAIFERSAYVGSTRYLLHVSRLRNSAAPVGNGQEALQHIHGLMIQLFPLSSMGHRDRERLEHWQDVEEPRDPQPGNDAREDETEVDVLHEVEAAIASTIAASEHEALSFAVARPEGETKALAHPRKFKDILVALFRFLAEDSRQAGKLTVTVGKKGRELVIGLQNHGFGIPNEKLQALLDGSAMPKSDWLYRIRQLRNSAFGAHGRLVLTSTVGGGYVVTAVLRIAG